MQKPIKEKIRQAVRVDRAIQLVWQAAPGWTLANLFLQIIQGILPLATLYLMKLIVDGVTLSITAADKAEAFSQIVFFIAIAAGIALLHALCQLLSNMANQAMSLTVTDHVFDLMHACKICGGGSGIL